MGLRDLLGGLRRREVEREATAAEHYAALVLQCANDMAVDEEYAAEVLANAGRTAEDLTADVDHEQERRMLVATVEEEANVRAELQARRQKLDAENTAFERAREVHQQKVDVLQRETNAHSHRLQEIVAAKQRLEGFSEPGAEERNLHEQLRDVAKRIKSARERPQLISRLQSEIEHVERKISQSVGDDGGQDRERLDELQRQLKDARQAPADVAELQAEEEALQRGLREARTRRLVAVGSRWESNGTLRIIFYEGAAETILRECPITAEAGTWYQFWFGDNQLFSIDTEVPHCGIWIDEQFRMGFVHQEDTFGLNDQHVALQSIATNYVDWNDFRIERTDDEEKNCDPIVECAWPNVAKFENTELEVELTGFTDDTCEECDNLNGTFTLSYAGYNPDGTTACPSLASPNRRCACWQFIEEIACGVTQITASVNAFTGSTPRRPGIVVAVGSDTSTLSFFGAGPPMTACGLNEWITMGNLFLSTINCLGPVTVRIRLKP